MVETITMTRKVMDTFMKVVVTGGKHAGNYLVEDILDPLVYKILEMPSSEESAATGKVKYIEIPGSELKDTLKELIYKGEFEPRKG